MKIYKMLRLTRFPRVEGIVPLNKLYLKDLKCHLLEDNCSNKNITYKLFNLFMAADQQLGSWPSMLLNATSLQSRPSWKWVKYISRDSSKCLTGRGDWRGCRPNCQECLGSHCCWILQTRGSSNRPSQGAFQWTSSRGGTSTENLRSQRQRKEGSSTSSWGSLVRQ